MSALRIQDDYRAAFTMFFSIPLTEAQLAKERVRAGRSGLAFLVKDIVTRGDIEDAAPPALSINMEGVGLTNRTHTWSTSGWPAWEDLPSTYAFSDGVELKDDEAFPEDAIEEKQWRREHGQQWNPKMSLRDNLIQREFYAKTNATQWMSTCLGLNLETLQALDQASTIYEVDSLILEVGDYAGPKALLVDSAQYLVHGVTTGWPTGRCWLRQTRRPISRPARAGVRHLGQCWTRPGGSTCGITPCLYHVKPA